MRIKFSFLALSSLGGLVFGSPSGSTYYNPILPGWHSDPSCTVVGDTFYCISSTFISFPGLPIYASKDLINWKLASHAWNRDSQLPGVSWNTTGQMSGMYAATIRHHDGVFYVICEYIAGRSDGGSLGVLYKSTDPFNNTAWSDPVTFRPTGIDPDLFWDDDGKVYVATEGTHLTEFNLDTGAMTPAISIWNGTGARNPEGPHIYKKDGWYYLMIAEGGTEVNHTVTIARSHDIKGPYESYSGNPILTARGTDDYFQTVGHADLFQDQKGNWWGVALATRSGPEWKVYPMGRETVLYPVTWEEGQWPVLEKVHGSMKGWPLPPANRNVPGLGPFNSDPDVYDFTDGKTTIPANLVYWRVPKANAFTPTPKGLQVIPSRANLTGIPSQIELSGQRGLAFLSRRQTHTLFDFTVDLASKPQQIEREAGVTIFLTQYNHADLGVVRLAADASSKLFLRLRFQATNTAPQPPTLIAIPDAWSNGAIRLRLQAANETHYTFSASSASAPDKPIVVGTASALLVSGGSGPFTGSLVGIYATCNGAGSGVDCPAGGEALFQRWRYTGTAQQVSATEFIPA
ncbi:Non-reducing end alpha-L-arabinofuranosidase BoGH43A [Cladobotryum mycophilum]|uniref:Non-reducing end alpha-L-arabinofuranosidase BoGH43A n=1 Tax=Cladobotryum mycophilum TaxID=491253 RepID=A0ABR0SXK2_9HYPO